MSEQTSCHEILKSLADYFDGDLDDALCIDLERHLCECDQCRIVVDTLRKTIDLYQITTPKADTPSDVRERLYKRLNLEEYLKKETKRA